MDIIESWKRCALKTVVILHIFAVFYIAYGSPLFPVKEDVKERLRSRIEASSSGFPSMLIGNESIKTTKALPNFWQLYT